MSNYQRVNRVSTDGGAGAFLYMEEYGMKMMKMDAIETGKMEFVCPPLQGFNCHCILSATGRRFQAKQVPRNWEELR